MWWCTKWTNMGYGIHETSQFDKIVSITWFSFIVKFAKKKLWSEMWFNGLEATGECLQSFDNKGEMQGRHTSHVTTAVYFRQLEKINTRKRWKCFWPDWLVTTSASAALSKKSILDYFSECWLSNEPQLRQDVCDNHDRGWHLVGSLLGFLLGWKISEYCRKVLLSWKGIDYPICRIIHHS